MLIILVILNNSKLFHSFFKPILTKPIGECYELIARTYVGRHVLRLRKKYDHNKQYHDAFRPWTNSDCKKLSFLFLFCFLFHLPPLSYPVTFLNLTYWKLKCNNFFSYFIKFLLIEQVFLFCLFCKITLRILDHISYIIYNQYSFGDRLAYPKTD